MILTLAVALAYLSVPAISLSAIVRPRAALLAIGWIGAILGGLAVLEMALP